MDLGWHDLALIAAGLIGSVVAVVHGFIIQRRMVNVIIDVAESDKRFSAPIRRLVPVLLHVSTAVWFVGGVALIAAALCADRQERVAVALLVGGSYLYAAIGNCWATRGRHPGWILMALACVLIVAGIAGT